MNPKICGYYSKAIVDMNILEVFLEGLTQKSMAQRGSKYSVRELKAGTHALAVPERGWGVSWSP